MRWACGVTTVPSRRQYPLTKTLESVKAAGFLDLHLFVDGDDNGRSWQREFGCNVTCRMPRVHTYANWILSLAELYCRNAFADRYAIFQDDVILCKGVSQYMEKAALGKHYWNLYTHPRSEGLKGWHEGDMISGGEPMQKGLGAAALVFTRDAVQLLLRSAHMVERPATKGVDPRGRPLANIKVDGAIVTVMNNNGYRELCHTPSLAQHIGLVSSMGSKRHAQAASFPGEHFDASRLEYC